MLSIDSRSLRQQPPRSDPPPADGLARLVAERFEIAADARRYHIRRWAECLSFYVGEQHRVWNELEGRMVRPLRAPSWMTQDTWNQIPGIVDATAAKLNRMLAIPRAAPDEPDDPEDTRRAALGTQAIRSWWSRSGMSRAIHELNFNRILFGTAALHLVWDPDAIAKVAVPDILTGKMNAAYLPVGELRWEVLTVFDFFPEPCENWNDVGWIIVSRRKPIRWFFEHFPDAAPRVRPSQSREEELVQGLLPGYHRQGSPLRAADERGRTATLRILYEAPCGDYPEGRTVLEAGDVILADLPRLPLEWHGNRNPLPIKPVHFRLVPRSLWGKGLVEECIGSQRELNRSLNNLSAWLKFHAFPKWVVPREARVDPKAITTAPNEIVMYNSLAGTPAPQHSSPPPMPSWVGQYPSMQREELRHVSGLHEVSEGTVPRRVSAASAISLLQSALNERNESPGLLGQHVIEEIAQQVLAVLSARYRERRYHPNITRDGRVESPVFSGEEFGSLEVVIDSAAGGESSDGEKQEQVYAWINAGLWQFLGTPLTGTILQIMREVGEAWLADAIEKSLPALTAGKIAQDRLARLAADQQAQAELIMQAASDAREERPAG